MAEIEFPKSFALVANQPDFNRFITADEKELLYTSPDYPNTPRTIGLMVFFSRKENPGLAEKMQELTGKSFAMRIFELDPNGEHRIVSSYSDIIDSEQIYLTIKGGPEEGIKARLVPEENDFAFATTRPGPGNDYNLRTQVYAFHEVKDINPIKATIRLAKTFG